VSQINDNKNLITSTVHFIVTGRVQGVFFRVATKNTADRYGITGWVRNLPDGRVEGMAMGDEKRVEIFREWLKSGPEMASVLKLEVDEVELQEFDEFEIR